MIKKYMQDQAGVIQSEKELEKHSNKLQPHIEELFFAGKIQSDRKSIVKSLNDVTCFLGMRGVILTYKTVYNLFLNRDGSALGKSNIKKSVAAGNKIRKVKFGKH